MTTTLKQAQVRTKRPIKKGAMPRLPHERDESDDSQASAPREDMQQAYDDLQRGLVDTDLHGARGVEKVVGNTEVPGETPDEAIKKTRGKGPR